MGRCEFGDRIARLSHINFAASLDNLVIDSFNRHMASSPDILRLLASGARISHVAELLGIPESQVKTELDQAIRATVNANVDIDTSREIELTHLDMLRGALTPLALKGDMSAARILVRISEARARILGLIGHQETEEAGENELDRIRQRRNARRETAL